MIKLQNVNEQYHPLNNKNLVQQLSQLHPYQYHQNFPLFQYDKVFQNLVRLVPHI